MTAQCQPASFCAPSGNKCACTLVDNPKDPYQHGLFEQCQPDASGESPICKWGQADVKCPNGGCYGFSFTLPANFSNKTSVPPPVSECFVFGGPFDVDFARASSSVAGSCYYSSAPQGQFCTGVSERIDQAKGLAW